MEVEGGDGGGSAGGGGGDTDAGLESLWISWAVEALRAATVGLDTQAPMLSQ